MQKFLERQLGRQDRDFETASYPVAGLIYEHSERTIFALQH